VNEVRSLTRMFSWRALVETCTKFVVVPCRILVVYRACEYDIIVTAAACSTGIVPLGADRLHQKIMISYRHDTYQKISASHLASLFAFFCMLSGLYECSDRY